jgi:hypothetical protein
LRYPVEKDPISSIYELISGFGRVRFDLWKHTHHNETNTTVDVDRSIGQEDVFETADTIPAETVAVATFRAISPPLR